MQVSGKFGGGCCEGKCYHVVSFGDDGEGASSDLLADGVYSHLFV